MYKVFERKCTLKMVYSLKDDQVSAKYVTRVTRSRFFVNSVVDWTKSASINKV